MTTTNPFVALFQASLPIYEQMRRDQARASEPVLALLQCLEANLFNPDCNVNFLKRKTGYRDNSVVLTFHSELGFTLRDYIVTCRMETAARLLEDSTLKIREIAEILGYSSTQTFGKGFFRWGGLYPSAFRKVRRQAGHGEASLAGGQLLPTRDFLCRALRGDLSQDEAASLIAHLRARYPTGRDCPEAE